MTKKMAGEMSQFGVDCVVVAESLLLCRLEIICFIHVGHDIVMYNSKRWPALILLNFPS